eukprot:2279775-Lingulodinium_polyedra.AAC.1
MVVRDPCVLSNERPEPVKLIRRRPGGHVVTGDQNRRDVAARKDLCFHAPRADHGFQRARRRRRVCER